MWKVHVTGLWSAEYKLVSFAAVIRVVTQRFSLITTLITAAKETKYKPNKD